MRSLRALTRVWVLSGPLAAGQPNLPNPPVATNAPSKFQSAEDASEGHP